MPLIASEVMDRAAAFLSDPAKNLFTYEVQLPFLKQANDELADRITLAGISIDRMVDAEIAVDAEDEELTLPNDFLLPISLLEKQDGQDNTYYVPMVERKWKQNLTQTTYHQVWEYRDYKVYFPPSEVDTVIQLNYLRIIAPVVDDNSELETERAMRFLTARTAEHCARYPGSNSALANELKASEGEPALEAMLDQFIKNSQGVKIRRRPFRRRRYFLISGR